jgi:hypothetical protein
MELEEAIIRGTARGAMLAAVLRWFVDGAGSQTAIRSWVATADVPERTTAPVQEVGVSSPSICQTGDELARLCWTVGWLGLLLHTAAAFHWQHQWSQAAAFEHTRQQTLALTGWNSGAGLWANELVLLCWTLDVIGWWWRPHWPAETRAWQIGFQSFLIFMIVNATIVFGPRGWVWVGVTVAIVWIGLIGQRSRSLLARRAND